MAIVWRGLVELTNENESVQMQCVAKYAPYPQRLPVTSAVYWPRHIRCTNSNSTTYFDTLPELNEADTQWFVEFVPVERDGSLCNSVDLPSVVGKMFAPNVAFLVPVFRSPAWNGYLHVFISTGQLVGVYRPVFRAGAPVQGASGNINPLKAWNR